MITISVQHRCMEKRFVQFNQNKGKITQIFQDAFMVPFAVSCICRLLISYWLDRNGSNNWRLGEFYKLFEFERVRQACLPYASYQLLVSKRYAIKLDDHNFASHSVNKLKSMIFCEIIVCICVVIIDLFMSRFFFNHHMSMPTCSNK